MFGCELSNLNGGPRTDNISASLRAPQGHQPSRGVPAGDQIKTRRSEPGFPATPGRSRQPGGRPSCRTDCTSRTTRTTARTATRAVDRMTAMASISPDLGFTVSGLRTDYEWITGCVKLIIRPQHNSHSAQCESRTCWSTRRRKSSYPQAQPAPTPRRCAHWCIHSR